MVIRCSASQLWRFWYMVVSARRVPIQRHTKFSPSLQEKFTTGSERHASTPIGSATLSLRAQLETTTGRSCFVRYLAAHQSETRGDRAIRVLFGLDDAAVSPSMVARNGERRRLHVGTWTPPFIIDERRIGAAKLIALAERLPLAGVVPDMTSSVGRSSHSVGAGTVAVDGSKCRSYRDAHDAKVEPLANGYCRPPRMILQGTL